MSFLHHYSVGRRRNWYYLSLYYAAQAATVLYWSRLFDKVGLKPVLLCGLLGTMVSSLLGLSRSFWALVLRFGTYVWGLVHPNLLRIAVV